jgi:hypothetical protein
VMLFDGANREQVAALGEARRPSIADVFVAVMGRPKTANDEARMTNDEKMRPKARETK